MTTRGLGPPADRQSRTLQPPAADDGAYASGATCSLPGGTVLWRATLRIRESPWWFSDDGSGRFDLVEVSDTTHEAAQGTCYLASDQIGALRETLAKNYRVGAVLARDHFTARVLWACDARVALTAADLLDDRWGQYNITNELFDVAEYDVPQLWAKALYRCGFRALRVRLRHVLSASRFGVALFGLAGYRSEIQRFRSASLDLGPQLIARFEAVTGIEVREPPQFLDQLNVMA